MKAADVEIVRAASLEEALELLAGENVRVLAGGQSLVPALNLRLDAPALLVDINYIPGLDRIERQEEEIVIGPLVRHATVARSQLVAEAVPLLAMAMAHVAHPAIRNRGTTLGSLAYADPAAEMPAVAVALDAVLVVASATGRRKVPARDYFLGVYETAREEDEMLVEARFPAARAGERFGFGEVARRHGDFPSVGIAGRAAMEGARIERLELVVFASEPAPLMCGATGEAARDREWSPDLIDRLAASLADEIDPMANLAGSMEVKRHQARALASRVLKEMADG